MTFARERVRDRSISVYDIRVSIHIPSPLRFPLSLFVYVYPRAKRRRRICYIPTLETTRICMYVYREGLPRLYIYTVYTHRRISLPSFAVYPPQLAHTHPYTYSTRASLSEALRSARFHGGMRTNELAHAAGIVCAMGN